MGERLNGLRVLNIRPGLSDLSSWLEFFFFFKKLMFLILTLVLFLEIYFIIFLRFAFYEIRLGFMTRVNAFKG